ncbi:enoyl-CoA hydratase 2, peroxisomal-like isoform X4 [Cajanus cajan]|uniref:enoyl-CoA hydratase 2, peroxisomal-like isoform X4 n=1 Tax=Cajanus cajan TaxID=3821 RepID=UPI0010FB5F4B|nr:enoyl-CoA hydratase 2, peroxisomal-like isoform X4 [Cajanus cajan]
MTASTHSSIGSSCGKAAVLEVETKRYEKESGDLLCMNRTTVYLRGAGGFSKTSKPFSYTNYLGKQTSTVKIPESKPFSVFEDRTQPSHVCYNHAILFGINFIFHLRHYFSFLALPSFTGLSSVIFFVTYLE